MPRLYWKDMGSDVGHLSPVGLLIRAPLSHWSRLAEQNLNCRLNPNSPPPHAWRKGDKTGKSNSQPNLSPPSFSFQSSSLHLRTACHGGEEEKYMCDGEKSTHTHTHGLLDKWVKEGGGASPSQTRQDAEQITELLRKYFLALKLTVEEDWPLPSPKTNNYTSPAIHNIM